jgi:hypothetical protein
MRAGAVAMSAELVSDRIAPAIAPFRPADALPASA